MGAVVAIPVVWTQGISDADEAGNHVGERLDGWEDHVSVDKPGSRPVVVDTSLHEVEFVENWSGAQATYIDLSTQQRMGTATERFARPALSLVKLYVAYYVVEHGTPRDRDAALAMVSDSSDGTADVLFAQYTGSIDAVAEEFGLASTKAGQSWGTSRTSTYDVATFVATLVEHDPQHPVLEAMKRADRVAADGYAQNFGTAVLPGAIGSKWGWSNARDLHSSVTFGTDWVAAAAVNGDADDLTAFVEANIGKVVK